MAERHSWSDRLLAMEALGALCAAALAVRLLPFRVSSRLYRLRPGADGARGDDVLARRVGWAIAAASRRTPWTSTCLMQSLAAARLLQRRRVGAVVHLGVAKDRSADGWAAHSWLVCGDTVATGAAERPRFTPVASYLSAGR